jgi:hypothetical protein
MHSIVEILNRVLAVSHKSQGIRLASVHEFFSQQPAQNMICSPLPPQNDLQINTLAGIEDA